MAREKSALHHEFRAGAVFYGGVSLAVYENGVARAFFDAATNAGLFGPLLELIDTRFIVDVVSGSSAGGINGLLLAAALEHGYPFRETAELWRQHGGIEDLLRPANEEKPASLLRGNTYYLTQLRRAFRKICRHHAEDYEAPQEIDVFVTGTDLAGAECSFVDAFGKDVAARTHRLVFHLQHREGRKQLGYVVQEQNHSSQRAQATTPEEQALQADILASVARVTSSFPGAFPPFTVKEFHDNPVERPEVTDTAERVRYALGRLCGRDLSHDPPLIDGGVLDNRPFGPLLEAVFHRMPSAEMAGCTRRVFYVDPDPDVLRHKDATEFSPLSVAVNSVVALPSYDSITADVDHVATHNARMAHLRAIRQRLALRSGDGAADSTLYRYALERELMALLNGASLPSPQDPDGAEQAELAERAGNTPALRRLSIGYHLRRASSLFYGYAFTDGTPAVDIRENTERSYQVGRVVKALKLLRDVWASELNLAKRQAAPLWPTLRERLRLLEHYIGGSWLRRPSPSYAVTSHDLSSDRLSELAIQARQELRRFLPQPAASGPAGAALTPEPVPPSISAAERESAGPGLLDLLERYLVDLLDSPAKLEDFANKDCSLYPLELASGTHELDEIKIVRISPEDPELPRDISGRAKLTGDELAHFSAFLRRDFRTNDVAWGHVDAIDRIARALLADDARCRARVRLDEVAPAFTLDALQASAEYGQVPTAHQTFVQEDLKRLAAAFAACRAEGVQLSPATWARFVDTFITAAQTRAAAEYIELIAEDAKAQDQAFNWSAPPLQLTRGSALSQLVALRHGEKPILQALPPSLVVEYAARAALLLWGMIGESLPDSKRLAGARPFVVGPLSIIHALATLMRREERVVKALMLGTLAASLAFIASSAWFGASIKLLAFGLVGITVCVLLAAYMRSLHWWRAAAIATTLVGLAATIWVLVESSISVGLPWSETPYTHNFPVPEERDAAGTGLPVPTAAK
jgi:predicted acylesterase/phospholipase RssA